MAANKEPGRRWHADRATTRDPGHNLTLATGTRHRYPTDPAGAFRRAMQDSGLSTADGIVADGDLHRIHLEGDRAGTRNGWYVLHPNPPVSGAFGCWKRGISGAWTAAGEDRLTAADRAEIRRRAEEARAARLVDQSRRHEEARQRARRIWREATPARPDHPYLTAKRVAPGVARQQGDRLVLPVADLHGRIWSLQFIDPTGGKLLLAGGRKRGNVIPVSGTMPGAPRVLICEGWATGATLADLDPAALVLAAIDAGNLEPAALAVRERWPAADIVICCDADEVGITKGRAAAIAAGGSVAIPEFPAGVPGSDFNDLANARAVEAAA